MTNKEAIKFGKEQLEIFGEDSLMNEFIRMSIQSLEERPKGKWIESQEEFDNAFIIFKHECSNCKEITFGGGNFCPNCGADMRGE